MHVTLIMKSPTFVEVVPQAHVPQVINSADSNDVTGVVKGAIPLAKKTPGEYQVPNVDYEEGRQL